MEKIERAPKRKLDGPQSKPALIKNITFPGCEAGARVNIKLQLSTVIGSLADVYITSCRGKSYRYRAVANSSAVLISSAMPRGRGPGNPYFASISLLAMHLGEHVRGVRHRFERTGSK